MRLGKKLLIGALTLLVGAGVGEYKLYKKFEHTPNPIREMLRWPYNDVWTDCNSLFEEHKQLTEPTLQPIQGRIHNLDCLELRSFRGDAINFIEMENNTRYVYTGNFFAGKGDEVILRVLPTQEILKMSERRQAEKFKEEVRTYRKKHPDMFWTTREYDDISFKLPSIQKSFEEVPLTKLTSLDGIIGDFKIKK